MGSTGATPVIGGEVIRLLLAGFGLCAVAVSAGQAQPATPSPAVCVYESKSYSDGALICVYRKLMLSCLLDGAKASWKPVTDSGLVGVCATTGERPRVAEVPRRHRRHGVIQAARVNTDASAKCFTFAGKRYCE